MDLSLHTSNTDTILILMIIMISSSNVQIQIICGGLQTTFVTNSTNNCRAEHAKLHYWLDQLDKSLKLVQLIVVDLLQCQATLKRRLIEQMHAVLGCHLGTYTATQALAQMIPPTDVQDLPGKSNQVKTLRP